MWQKIINFFVDPFKEEIDDKVIQYSKLQHENQSKSKIFHQYELNEIFPFKLTMINEDETLDDLIKLFGISRRELLYLNGIFISKDQTIDLNKEAIDKKFKPAKYILVPQYYIYKVFDKSRFVDISVSN